jgi:hypothetical protein
VVTTLEQRTFGTLVAVTGYHEPASWRLRWADDLGRHEPTHGRVEERTGVSSTADGLVFAGPAQLLAGC